MSKRKIGNIDVSVAVKENVNSFLDQLGGKPGPGLGGDSSSNQANNALNKSPIDMDMTIVIVSTVVPVVVMIGLVVIVAIIVKK